MVSSGYNLFGWCLQNTYIVFRGLPDDFLKYLSQKKYEIITIPGDTVFAGRIKLSVLGDEKVLSF